MLFLNRSASLAILSVTLGCLLYGCGESKVTQCNRLNTVANKIKSVNVPKDPAGLMQLADSMDGLRTELQTVKVEDEKLKGFQTRFVELYTEASQAAREVSKAYAAKDRPAFEKATKASETAVTKEEPLVNEVNQYCTQS